MFAAIRLATLSLSFTTKMSWIQTLIVLTEQWYLDLENGKSSDKVGAHDQRFLVKGTTPLDEHRTTSPVH